MARSKAGIAEAQFGRIPCWASDSTARASRCRRVAGAEVQEELRAGFAGPTARCDCQYKAGNRHPLDGTGHRSLPSRSACSFLYVIILAMAILVLCRQSNLGFGVTKLGRF